MHFKAILDTSSIQRKFCFKPTPDITYTWNKLSKNIFIFFGHYYKYFEKKQQNLSIKTPPQVNKKGKRLFAQFNNHLDLYNNLYNIKVRGQCYVKAIEVEPLQKYIKNWFKRVNKMTGNFDHTPCKAFRLLVKI